MKILFDGVDFSGGARNGPSVFAKRLAFQFLAMGHVIADPDDYDIVLAFIEPSFNNYKKPLVLRLDGIWFRNQYEFDTKNKRIKSCYSYADHVIFQSEFDKNMVSHWWGTRESTIINNGILINPLRDTAQLATEILDIRSKHDKVFCCSANWHGQKRLKQNIELFRYLKTNFYPKSCLIVMGSNPESIPGTDIFYTGSLPHDICEQIFSISDWMIHLAYLDHCPNTVIESLAQSTPVICTSSGGTKELVKDFGIILQEPVDYKFELVDYENPPLLDVSQVKSELSDSLGEHANIDIKSVGERYIDVFKQII